MDNTNKLLDQIKAAAESAENREFPLMDKVWSRVEDKLDNKVLAKQNTFWKKTAIAASILLAVFIGYHCFTSEEKTVIVPKDTLATDTLKAIIPQNQEAVVSGPAQTVSPQDPAILQKPAAPDQIVINNNYTINSQPGSTTIIKDSVVFRNQPNIVAGRPSKGFSTPIFSARGVVYTGVEGKSQFPDAKKETQENAKKLDPLIVIDNKAAEKIDLESEEIESMEVLSDPMYIINGSYYTEKEMFGPKPTSPYAPLSKLKIETITILQNEKAIAIYGERGKKGVVIITTKSGKPEFK